jgi:hypothetical protein
MGLFSYIGDKIGDATEWVVGKTKDGVDKVVGVTDDVKEKITGVQDSIQDAVSTQIREGIEGTINSWVSDVMQFVLLKINEWVFEIPENEFVMKTVDFLGWFTSIFAVVLVLYKIIEYIINTQNGTQQYPLDEILLRAVKSAGAILILPWFLKFVFFDIALNLADAITILGSDFGGSDVSKALTVSVVAFIGTGGGAILFTLVLIFFTVVFISFLYSMCVFYADYTIMMILTAPVALSMIADDNNFFQVWWREMLSMVTSMLLKLFLVTLVINCLFAGGTNILIAIGAGGLIIKTPSVMKNMWYAGGGARGGHRASTMGSRMLMMQMMRAMK